MALRGYMYVPPLHHQPTILSFSPKNKHPSCFVLVDPTCIQWTDEKEKVLREKNAPVNIETLIFAELHKPGILKNK